MAISTRDTRADDGGDPFFEDAAPKKSKFGLKKSKVEAAGWLDDVEEVPRTDLPDGQRLARRAKWTKWYLIACAVLAPILMLMVLVAVAKPAPEFPKQKPAEAMTRERAEAMVTVQNWLASPESPLSNARVLGWESTTDLPGPPKPENANAAQVEEDPVSLMAVRFLVAQTPVETSEGQIVGVDSAYASTLYLVEVLVAETESGAVTTVGKPSLLPTPPSIKNAVTGADRWPSLEDAANPTDQAQTAITAWAAAMTSGSPQDLRSVVNDGDGSRAYVPLTGMTLLNTQVGDGAVLKTTGGEEPEAKEIVVAVTLTMTDNPACEDCRKAVAEYDVLITDANTVTPRVVAWGAPGTGPVLVPYMNAVPTNEVLNGALQDLEEEAADESPTSTPSTSTPPDPSASTKPKKKEN